MNANVLPVMTLHVLTFCDAPSDLAHTFGEKGGTLGRSAECDMVFDDPGKNISRIHARILWRDGGFVFCSLAANPVYVNDVPLLTGQEVQLTHLARIRIGAYLLQAVLPHVPAGTDQQAIELPAPTPPLQPIQVNPANALQDDGAGAPARFFSSDGHENADPLGLELLGGMTGTSAARPRAAAAGAYRGAECDQLAPQNQTFASFTGNASAVIPDDYDPLADHQPRTPANAPRAAGTGGEAVVAAFLKGLGQPDLQTELDPLALAELAGALLREATAGTMAALLGRSLTKRESRVDVTMLARQANNPLKFFPDADMALAQMLGRRSSAYLSPVRAFKHAFDDLRAHELAVVAAMRAAMQEVLEQASPRAIEKKLPQDSALDKLFSGSRKARLWDCHVDAYAKMSVDANDRFSRSFNEKFAVAYEQQMHLIRKAKR